ncbi:MAG: hypothetical protein HY304_05855 [candidate division Zixibacteria bacterium]|nr:hypothetical protein [candidate division Zixibacteria bacterium]
MNWELTITALLTLAIYSFLYGDNPFYRFAEHLLVGLSIGYSLVLTVGSIIMPKVVTPLAHGDFAALVPLLLGGAMFLRLSTRLGRWSQIPMALLIGAGAGASIPAMLQARVLKQMASTISGVGSVDGAIILMGVLATLTYFVFTREQTGLWGKSATVGRYFMMIFFGATFAYTVMSRVALLIGRLEFLLGDWLHTL